MNTNSCCCGGSSTSSPCSNSIAELPRYYPRQLITPADLTLEQDYFRDRMRRHNRLLHGWGVVCGAMVCPVTITNPDNTTSYAPWLVQVQTGYVLGPYGDEILLDCPRTVDVRTQGVSGVTGEVCIDAPDPWCTEVFTPPTTTIPTVYYIAVKYVQSMTRPVRVQPVGCGCDDSSCEYSRWHDGYQIGVLTQCPRCNACDPNVVAPPFQSLTTGDCPPCPDCSCGPWVCLAAVTVNSDGTIAQIDNCSCRRLVLSFSSFWWQCTATLSGLQVAGAVQVTADPQNIVTVAITVTGTNLNVNAKYTFGPGSGVTVKSAVSTPGTAAGTSVDLTVNIASNASGGMYGLTVVNPDCSTAILASVINVTATTPTLKTAAAPKGGRMVTSKPKKTPAPPEG